ncbi:MAG: Re/Si-specific NAD(P)(+) transhydrogenase subunit alpha [Candidatus Pelagibacterales bacterium]|jgi:NAD(P) transhydrogenase subunit alpha
MKIFIPKEINNENRVAATPDSVKKFISMGHDVIIEPSAGVRSNFGDDLYKEVGASISDESSSADIILKVGKPLSSEVAKYKDGSLLIAMLDPYNNRDLIDELRNKNITTFAMEWMPRITRAQSMDVLSSQSNLSGYKAVIEASSNFNKAMPMMMTAAGTIAPAKVMVFGAGVAGLQAIATAKRLGAVVSATDVRLAAKEQVESLGGKFVIVESDELKDAETAGGYAKEMSEDFKRQQAELIASTLSNQDIAICTALIPGKKAPTLITEANVKSMKPGSVIMDLAAQSGGNCELSKPGETVVVDGVSIIGATDFASDISQDASSLYSKNLLNFMTILFDSETNDLNIDWEDEIIVNTALTKDGAFIHKEFI